MPPELTPRLKGLGSRLNHVATSHHLVNWYFPPQPFEVAACGGGWAGSRIVSPTCTTGTKESWPAIVLPYFAAVAK